MAAMEERYKKYLGKAKSVIKTLDPKQNPALGSDLSTLRAQLTEKERTIETLEVILFLAFNSFLLYFK